MNFCWWVCSSGKRFCARKQTNNQTNNSWVWSLELTWWTEKTVSCNFSSYLHISTVEAILQQMRSISPQVHEYSHTQLNVQIWIIYKDFHECSGQLKHVKIRYFIIHIKILVFTNGNVLISLHTFDIFVNRTKSVSVPGTVTDLCLA